MVTPTFADYVELLFTLNWLRGIISNPLFFEEIGLTI